ncbi:MAG: hypothetical protein AB1635_04705 [Acidobacteriota bacterium]
MLVAAGGLATLIVAGPWIVETFVSDAATRLAYQIRDEAAALRVSGETRRVFTHHPRAWPDGVSGDYRIEIRETRTSPRPGHRSIGVARSLDGPTWYATSYHLNYVDVPRDLSVAHRRGEPTRVTLERSGDRVRLVALE